MAIDIQKDRQVRNLLCVIDDLAQVEDTLQRQMGQIKYFREYSTPGVVTLKVPIVLNGE